MTDFIQSIPASWISAVSMTLLHSVWQGLIIVLLLNISLYLAKSASSSIRYTLSVLALLALSGSTFTTFYVQITAYAS
jgi:bla regulator protein BlaR1